MNCDPNCKKVAFKLILKNFRVKDQRENSACISHTEQFSDHIVVSGVVIALYVGRTEPGYEIPDIKIVTMVIKPQNQMEKYSRRSSMYV